MITLNAFQRWTGKLWGTDERPYNDRISIMGLGLTGESGEAVEHVKKFIRDGKPLVGNYDFARELGDAFYYLSRLAAEAGFTLEEIAMVLEVKLTARRAEKGKATPALKDE